MPPFYKVSLSCLGMKVFQLSIISQKVRTYIKEFLVRNIYHYNNFGILHITGQNTTKPESLKVLGSF